MQLTCLSKQTTQDAGASRLYDYLIRFLFWQKDANIARHVEGGFNQVKEDFRLAIMKGQKTGEISSDKDPDMLAGFLAGIFYGLQMMGGSMVPNPKVLKNVISNALD